MELSLELICRPLIAGLLGAIIGLDRAYRAKESGDGTGYLRIAWRGAEMELFQKFDVKIWQEQNFITKNLEFAIV